MKETSYFMKLRHFQGLKFFIVMEYLTLDDL